MEQAIFQALAKDPEKRFARVDALITAFSDVLTGPLPVTIPPQGSQLAPELREMHTVPSPARPGPLAARVKPIFERVGLKTPRMQLAVVGGAALLCVVGLWLALRPPAMGMTPEGLIPAERVDLVDKLYSGRSCKDRRTAALQLIQLDDKRYLESLRAARERRGGFFGVQRVNGCMTRELDAAIRRLEAK